MLLRESLFGPAQASAFLRHYHFQLCRSPNSYQRYVLRRAPRIFYSTGLSFAQGTQSPVRTQQLSRPCRTQLQASPIAIVSAATASSKHILPWNAPCRQIRASICGSPLVAPHHHLQVDAALRHHRAQALAPPRLCYLANLPTSPLVGLLPSGRTSSIQHRHLDDADSTSPPVHQAEARRILATSLRRLLRRSPRST